MTEVELFTIKIPRTIRLEVRGCVCGNEKHFATGRLNLYGQIEIRSEDCSYVYHSRYTVSPNGGKGKINIDVRNVDTGIRGDRITSFSPL